MQPCFKCVNCVKNVHQSFDMMISDSRTFTGHVYIFLFLFLSLHLAKLALFPEPGLTWTGANIILARINLANCLLAVCSSCLMSLLTLSALLNKSEAPGNLTLHLHITIKRTLSTRSPQAAEIRRTEQYGGNTRLSFAPLCSSYRWQQQKYKKLLNSQSAPLLTGSKWKNARVREHPPARLPGLCSVAVA